jgi:hypothetical protein
MDKGGSDVVAHFRTGLDLLKRYPVMILPPLAVHIILAVLTFVFIGGAVTAAVVGGGAGILAGMFGFLALSVLTGILSLMAAGVTLVMARDAVAGREPSVGDAVGEVTSRLGDVLIASILVMLIVGLLGMVFFFLLGLPGLIAAFFLIYTLPAVLLDNLPAIDAIKRSVTLVKNNIGPTALFIVGCLVAWVVIYLVGRVVGAIPLLGHLAQAVLLGVAIAYFAIVGVRVYQTLPRR